MPRLPDAEAVILASGILEATVMPHVIFLHSALMQGRVVAKDPGQMRRLFRFEVLDVTLAMGVAGLINAAMLIMAAVTFHNPQYNNVGSIQQAHATLAPLLGPAASWVFAISLLAAGLSSSSVGTMSGQVIMQGFLRRHIPVWVRRLATIAPSLAVIIMGLDPTRTLVISQVLLSFGLPFAVIPLVVFTSRRDVMGSLVNRLATTIIASLVALLIVSLNVFIILSNTQGRMSHVQASAGPTGRLTPGRGSPARGGLPGRSIGGICHSHSHHRARRAPGGARRTPFDVGRMRLALTWKLPPAICRSMRRM